MYPVCFLSLSLSHSCCHIPKSMPMHSSPLPSLFSPDLGPPLHCFLLTQLFFSLHLSRSQPHHFLSLLFFFKFSCKISFIQSIIEPRDPSHHKSQENTRSRDDNECITTVRRRHHFSAGYFVTMLTQSVTSRPTGVLRVTVHISDQMSQGWNRETHAWNKLERQRMALIILSPCRKGQGMCQTGYSSFVLVLWLSEQGWDGL